MADDVGLVRSRVDLIALVGERVALKRSGKNWKGLCPFHADKTPSFYVSPDIGTYKCFACGEKGDAFTWVMKTQNMDFREALDFLARQTGVQLSSKSASPEERSRREQGASAMESALNFFLGELDKNRFALDYCESRGLSDKIQQEWQLGFAPDLGEALVAHLKRAGYSLEACKELFLVDGDPGNGYHDRFRSRLMFPIHNERGDLVAFGGRILGAGQPKYINSGDTPLFSKGRVLYGMNRAKNAMNETRQVVLVEGYLDVIACHQAGVKNAVASLGTSLAEGHVELLRRWIDSAVVFYDCDAAGLKAAERAQEMLEGAGIPVRFALMPEGDDPDTLLRREGPAAVRDAVNDAKSSLDFHIMLIERRLRPEQEEYWTEVVTMLASASSDLQIESHLVRLASRYPGLRDPLAAQKALRRQVLSIRRRKSGRKTTLPTDAENGPKLRTAMSVTEQCVFYAILDPELRPLAWRTATDPSYFVHGEAIELASALQSEESPSGPASAWIHTLGSEIAKDALTNMVMADGPILSVEIIEDVVRRLKVKREERAIRNMMKGATDSDEVLRDLSSRLKSLKVSNDDGRKAGGGAGT